MILVLGMQELKPHLIEHRAGTGLDAPEAPQVILLGGSAHSWEQHRRLDSGQLILTDISFSPLLFLGCVNRKLGC